MTALLALAAAWALCTPIVAAWLYVSRTDSPTGDRSRLDMLDGK